MDIQQRPIASIHPYEKNAKVHPEKQINQIAGSIKEFGFNQPIVVDADGVIIVGHGRYAAATVLGMEMVPVLQLDLTEEQARTYRLADNKLNESEWDMTLVIEELKELPVAMVDLAGFSRDLLLTHEEKDNVIPDVSSNVRTILGDVYELGPHRVVCGDSTTIEPFEKLMNGRHADLLLTDPPYNVAYKGKTKDALEIDNDDMDESTFRQFLTDAFVGGGAYLKPGASFYIWHADMQGHNFMMAARAVGDWHIAQKLIWNKNSMVLGRQDYQWKHEPCLYGWKEGATHLWNADRTQTTILNFDKPSTSEKHPTMKPVELLAYQITNSTKGEDIVLDPFLGSGSTLIAAHKTGRVCYGIELDPKYVDVIVERYCEFTGNREVVKNGETIVWE